VIQKTSNREDLGMDTYAKLSETYEIMEEIGSGGGGTVYKARHKRLDKYVVIKKVHSNIRDIVDCSAEANILKKVRHSYLPQVLDIFTIDGDVYTVMDFIPGKSFQTLLNENKRFPQKKVIKWATQVCEALVYLHKQNPPIIHSDIKPDNIMLMPNDDICLIDFNISSVFTGKGAHTVGFTDGYSPPEQYKIYYPQEAKPVSGETDSLKKARSEALSGKTGALPANTVMLSEKSLQGEKTEILSEKSLQGEKTEILSDGNIQDEKTEILSDKTLQEERTEILSDKFMQEYKTEILSACVPRDDRTEFNNAYQEAAAVREERPKSSGAAYGYAIVDEKADIYALGATLYHLITGVRPQKSTGPVEPVENHDVKISDGLKYIINKAMEKNPAKRFSSASQMLKALQNIGRLDRRYKRFMLTQELTFIIMLLLFSGSVMMMHFGRLKMAEEKQDRYKQYIEEMLEERLAGNYEEMESIYEQAVRIYPNRIDAYYQKALSYYEQRDYETAIDYIENNIIADYQLEKGEKMEDIYFILANCYFEQQDYTNAIVNFRSAIALNKSNPEYYRDFAISLARIGNTDKASETLKEAIEYGIADDSIYLIQGEIDLIDQNYMAAEENLSSCIQTTEDSYVKMRAYLKLGEVFDSMFTAESDNAVKEEILLKKIQTFKDARNTLPLDLTLGISEELIQAYIDSGTFLSDDAYYKLAIEESNNLISLNWDNYITYNNLIILYQKVGDVDNAYNAAKSMLSKFGEDYNIYKRLAYLEIEVQNLKENRSRDYSVFMDYYNKANELYDKEMRNNKNDIEMIRLGEIKAALVEGGWFE